MAIVRAGKRIGPFDIRGGISRGDMKSSAYHRTDFDPRFKQRSIKDSTIGRFRAAINSAEGFARPNRFAIRFFPPSSLANELKSANTTSLRGGAAYGKDTMNPNEMRNMASANVLYGRQINIMCDSVVMPGVDLNTQEIQFGTEPARNMVVGHGFAGNIVATFYADKYLRERQYFEMWQKLAVNTITHKANYYDNYVGKMHIYQLGADSEEDRDMPTYAVEAIEVYPEKIGTMDLNYSANNQIQKITIEFGYKQWFNMGLESAKGLEFGQSMQTMADVKSRDRGLFGKLPPSLQRAAKDIFQQGRTVLNPTGRIFKGKVFGPFT
tara:strand:+ start:258 stop:1229 length:972 start_codon:yes stop_codon:yes gene_type:complete